MLPIPSFDPSASASGGSISVGAADPGAKILFYNESNYNLLLNFQNGNQDMLHAWEARWWPLDGNTPELEWSVDSVLQSLGPPISKVMGTLYAAGEQLPGTYPVSLIRQTNVGNVINTVGGIASGIQNDTNTAGFEIAEATVQGDNASAVALYNNGHLSLGTFNNPAQLTLVCALGTITIDTNGKMTLPDQLLVNLLTALANNDLGFHVASGQRVVATINGVDTFSVNGNGANLLSGTLALRAGSISKIGHILNKAVLGGKTSINPGLGIKPDVVLLTIIAGGPITINASAGYDPATLSATNCDIYASNNFNVDITFIAF